MIAMEILGKIKRMFFRDKLSLHEIAKRTGLSRNTIRRWIRAREEAAPPRPCTRKSGQLATPVAMARSPPSSADGANALARYRVPSFRLAS